MPGLSTLTFSILPSLMIGVSSAPDPSGSLHENIALALAVVLMLDPFFLISTPTIAPMSSMIGSAFKMLVLCALSKIISGKHGFLRVFLDEQLIVS